MRRKRLRMTQEELAARVPMGEPQRSVSSDAVCRIEHGKPVEAYVMRPVLVFLELEPRTDLAKPLPDQHPGEWLRDLRETSGISPTGFCNRARQPRTGRALSRTTLMKIEGGTLTPGWRMMDRLETAFGECGVDVPVEALECAWRRELGPGLERTWGPEVDRAENP